MGTIVDPSVEADPRGRDPQRRIRVLLLVTSTAGGVGVHVCSMARYLPKSEFCLTVAFGPGYPFDTDVADVAARVIHLSLSRKISPWTNLRGLFQVLLLLKRNRFDVICTECSIAGFIGRLAGWLARVPVRIFVIQLYASHPHQSAFKKSVYRVMERALDRVTTRYVAVSQAMKTFGVDRRIMKPEKIKVIYNGIVVPRAEPPQTDRNRRALGLCSNGLIVGTLARLEPQKGLQYLIHATAILKTRFDNVEVVIAGEGPLRQELMGLSRSLGVEDNVRFVGWQQDSRRLIEAVDVFCLPSLWESFGMAMADAMALAKPVVATRVDGIPEVVADGEVGLLVPPRDSRALSDAISVLLNDEPLRRRMGRAGRDRVEKMFTADRMVRRYAELFKDEVRSAQRHKVRKR